MKKDATIITAHVLLNKVFEFTAMTPDESEWSLELQKDNPPRLIRLQQIEALLNIYLRELKNNITLKDKINYLLKGSFIQQRNIMSYQDCVTEMDNLIVQSGYKAPKVKDWDLYHLQENYLEVISYKKQLYQLLNTNDGVMEMSYHHSYSVLLKDTINATINTKPIDEFLALVIDPKKSAFRKNELIRQFDYPVEDVYEVDIDWM
jgi:hypothetical protein